MIPTQAAASSHARRGLCLFAVLTLTTLAGACRSSGNPSAAPRIELNSQTRTVDVSGLSSSALAGLSAASWSDADWQALLRVSVKSSAPDSASQRAPAVAGSYLVTGDVLRFTPMFPFDDGRRYEVVLDGGRLPGQTGGWRGTVTAVVGTPAVNRLPSTVVTHVFPSGDVVPANQLRMYVHFSAPMGWRSGHDYVALLDDRGEEVADAFLPLDADFWNDDRTRYTVFFDPGRVKRGILPNVRWAERSRTGAATRSSSSASGATGRAAAQGRIPPRVQGRPGDRAAAGDERLAGAAPAAARAIRCGDVSRAARSRSAAARVGRRKARGCTSMEMSPSNPTKRAGCLRLARPGVRARQIS